MRGLRIWLLLGAASMAGAGCFRSSDIDVPCKNDGNCDPTLFCRSPLGQCGAAGTCQSPDITSFPVDEPVCGCNGRTYRNTFETFASRTSVAHVGACEDPCDATRPCPSNFYCQYPLFQCSGSGTCHGLFLPAEQDYLCSGFSDPVCGCDGRTYTNRCYAFSSGINVATRGACAP